MIPVISEDTHTIRRATVKSALGIVDAGVSQRSTIAPSGVHAVKNARIDFTAALAGMVAMIGPCVLVSSRNANAIQTCVANAKNSVRIDRSNLASISVWAYQPAQHMDLACSCWITTRHVLMSSLLNMLEK